MQFANTETGKIVEDRLMQEIGTAFRYRQMAKEADRIGRVDVADVCRAVADNEMEHAQHCFDLLGGVRGLVDDLVKAQSLEHNEALDVYPHAAETAEREGFGDAADIFRRLAFAEESHEKLLAEVIDAIHDDRELSSRTVGHSETFMAQIMLPDQANPAGTIHGGELMKIMDNAAGAVAWRHCNRPVVTASVDAIEFLAPVKIGDIVITHGRLVFTGRSSLAILVEMEVERMAEPDRIPCNRAWFTMVALDDDGQPQPVPPLAVTTEEEADLFCRVKEERDRRKALRKLREESDQA
jgi:acyl-CoA hydrolase/ferritin